MRFPMPHYPSEFEIPDDWLREAGIIGFTPLTTSYCSTAGTTLVPLTAIEPVPRLVKKDFRGFERNRLKLALQLKVVPTTIRAHVRGGIGELRRRSPGAFWRT